MNTQKPCSLTARILAQAAGKNKVEVGETVIAKVDKVAIHEVTGAIVLDIIEDLNIKIIPDPERLYVFLDHYSPPPSIRVANIHRRFRLFAKNHKIKNFYDVGTGVCHQVMVEGLVKPGEVIVGADSHTTTYGALATFATGVGSTEATYALLTGELWFKIPEPIFIKLTGALPTYTSGKDVALYILSVLGQEGANYKSLEFFGSGLRSLSVSDRLAIANMSVECGAKNAIFPLDDILVDYLKEFDVQLTQRDVELLKPLESENPDITLNLTTVEPMVAKPHNPANVAPVKLVEGEKIDVAFIGSCTNGRYDDLLVAARILKRGRIPKDVRLVVTPSSRRVFMKALERGVMQILLNAGAIITPPGCGPCFGDNMNVLGDDEVAISSSNRNFLGRMGSPKAKIYLASPATVAASALNGSITDPRKYLGEG